MNISLTPQLEEMVKRKVASGLYTSASEVVSEALLLLDEHDHNYGRSLEELRQCVEDGINSGPSTPLDMEEIKREARQQWIKNHNT
jgi:antitoxin ParD1/3/4